jgi:hypothetical protein
MSDRPSAVNGKRNRAWGTRDACPACGQCLCFGCHPVGPCVDEQAAPGAALSSSDAATFAASGPSSISSGWYAAGPTGASGASGLRMLSTENWFGRPLL